MYKKLRFPFILSFLVRGCGALSMLLLTLLITQNLNPQESGIILQIFSLSIAFSLISRMGAENSVIKYLRNESKPNFALYFLRWSLNKSILIGFFLAFIYIVIFSVSNQTTDVLYLGTLLFLVPIQNVLNIKAIFYQSQNLILKSIFIKNILPYLITAILSLLGFLLFHEIKAFHFLIYYAIAASVIGLYGKKSQRILHLIPLQKTVKSIYCWKISINYLSVCIFQSTQQWGIILLGTYFLSKQDLGLLNVQFRIANVLTFVLIAINSIYTQQIASCFNSNNFDAVKKLFNKATKESAVIAIPLFLIMSFLSKSILGYFHEYYTQYYLFLIILLIGQLINVLTGPVMVIFAMSPTFHYKSKNLLYLTITNLFLGILCLYFLGLFGAILFQAISLVSINLILFYFVRKFISQVRPQAISQTEDYNYKSPF